MNSQLILVIGDVGEFVQTNDERFAQELAILLIKWHFKEIYQDVGAMVHPLFCAPIIENPKDQKERFHNNYVACLIKRADAIVFHKRDFEADEYRRYKKFAHQYAVPLFEYFTEWSSFKNWLRAKIAAGDPCEQREVPI